MEFEIFRNIKLLTQNYILLILLFLLTVPSLVTALSPNRRLDQYVKELWQSENGLPQNSVQTVLQTSDRYIWIGTQEGLVRFDGNSFKTFNMHNTPLLKSNDIKEIIEDHKKNIWIGTFGGGGAVRYNKYNQ